MQKWEYLVVEFARPEKKGMGASIAAHGAYRPRYVDGKEQANWQEMPYFRNYLGRLANKGGNLPVTDRHNTVATFACLSGRSRVRNS